MTALEALRVLEPFFEPPTVLQPRPLWGTVVHSD